MAVRPLHMHDGSGIAERRLRPIYDWLDNGNNKKALQEAEKVLKKAPSLQAARALKALALFRLGRGSEGQVVLDALADEKPSDDSTLQAMTISYRESQQLHKVCTLYEAAVKAEPLSEELHSHLFMSYVRVGDYRAQQRAAMALYKFAPKNPYYFWAVMSIVLQAKATSDAKQKGILLAVSQRMIDNFISEGKMEAEQEARLYIMILELQEKWEDIVKFLDSPLYTQLVPGSTNQACIPYLKRLSQWKRLNLICKELLYDNQDRWDFYMPYFDSVFELMKLTDNDSSVDDSPEKCHEFLCQIIESISGKSMRGPYLARLELWRRLSVIDGDPTTLLGSATALCRQYIRVFGHKACAVPDLRQYLAMIPQAEREENSRDFLTCLGFDEDSQPETSDDIQRHVSCVALYRLTAPPLPPEPCLRLAASLRAHYLRCARAGAVRATLTEFGPADSYAILAAHHYFYAGMQEKKSSHIVEALSLLELALHNSPANFHIKLLLVKLYHLLGNALAADTVYQKLEIKHVQLVSLGWLHGALLAPACAFSRALQLLADTRAFHSHHDKDSVEQVTAAYKYGTFDALCSLTAWGARLGACGAAAAAGRARAALALLAGPPQPLHQPRPLHDHPTDNRDLNVIVNFEPPQYQDEDLKRRTFEQDVAYLRLKDGLVTSLALCIESSDQRPLEHRIVQYKELKNCVEAFNTAMERCKQLYDVKERITISAPFPSRIIAFVTSPVPYRELYSCALSMVGELCVNQSGAAHALAAQLAALLDQAARLPAPAPAPAPTPDPVWGIRDSLEHLSNYLEFIGIMTYLLGVCHEYVTPTTTNANTKKSKKKTNQSPEEIKTLECLTKLNVTLQNSILTLENTLEQIPSYDSTSLEGEFSKLDVVSNFACPVQAKLKQGREEMLADVKNVLKKKVKYLKSLI